MYKKITLFFLLLTSLNLISQAQPCTAYPNSADVQTTAGTDSWIGHVYSGMNFNDYKGSYSQTEIFDESFGGTYTCFNITSGGTARTILTEGFSVKYRMNSTRKGLYIIDLGSDDGSRLTVDGSMVYNNWSDQAFSTKPSVLFKLTGTSNLMYEFYENAGGNQVVFKNLSLILANTLSTNSTQNICLGNTGLAISGDTYGTLPTGISRTGTGYQWTYSTTPGGARTNISGATAATYTPSTISAPFNVSGTYYLYRNANVTSLNNISPTSYAASLESNAAVVNVNTLTISQIPAANIIANYKFNGNANDEENNNNGTLRGGPGQATDRFGIASSAYNFDGINDYVSTNNYYTNPNNFTVSIWFKTNSISGGKLIGFGSSQLGSSIRYDRHIYMNNAGQIYFGVYPSTVVTVNSSSSYNDNKWHLATATLSVAGMVLYVDGTQIGSNNTTTTGENYSGYWRIGYGNLSGWTSQPSSNYFKGQLDDALIYNRALTPTEVATIYNSPDGAGNNGPVCSGSALTLNAKTITGATYSWSGPNGFSSTAQNPSFSYTAASAGTYTLQVTSGGCVATAYTNVVSSNNDGQWTGNISTDWANANNWCSGVVPTSTTDVTINSGALNMPVIGSNAYCNTLTISSAATVTTSLGGTLNVAGNIANNGTMTNNGTTNFNGTGARQTFSGITTFNNLTLNNTNGLLIPAVTTITGNLTLTSGILNANNFVIAVAGNWINNAGTNAFAAGTSGVVFNGSANKNISGSAITTFNNISVNNPGFVLSLAVNANIAGNLTVTKGTFDLGSFTANRTTGGGTLTVDNSATLKIGGTNTYPSNYATSNLVTSGTVEYSGTNQTVSSQAYGNLTFSSSAGAAIKTLPGTAMTVSGNLTSMQGAGTSVTFTAVPAITVNGNVSIGTATTFNAGSANHNIGGNWTNAGTFNGNTGKITFTGAGKTISGTGTQNFNDLTVAASGISFSNNNVNLSGNLATTGSGTFSQASGGTLTMTGASKTISGTGISLDNLSISGTVSTAISFNLTGNLNVTGTFTATPGTITMSGTAKTITGAGNINFHIFSATGSITASTNFSIASGLVVSGSLIATSGTATFTGTSVLSGMANLFNVTINGTSLQLSANSNLGIANTLAFTAGTLNTTSSVPNTVNFNGAGAQSINDITYDNLTLSNANNKTAIAGLTVNRNITIGTGAIFVAGNYTHSIYGNWINNGSFTSGTGTISFVGNQTSNITGATTFYILTENKNTASSLVQLQNNVSAATVNMTQGKMLTGAANTITITDTRTGNGIILGNIQRTHAFTTGVAYAFEGPNNTITFSSVSAVTSITVSVESQSVSDFPFGGSISRQYNISVPAGTYNATLRLHYEDNELNGTDEAVMALWNYNGSTWGAIGKTANNSTDNYVEHTGLSNITNRWTASASSSVVQWDGSESSDWNNADNWTVTQGSATAPPSSTDIVDLGTATFLHNPTISNVVTVKNINFGSVKAVTLTMTTGGSLVTGDIKGNWSSNVTHTINVDNQNITTNDLLLSDGTANHNINLNIGTGTVTVEGDLNQSGGAAIVFSGAGKLKIAADYNHVNGTFTAGTGTVTYNGLVNQVAGSVNYYNLEVNKTAALASINSTLSINGNLDVIAGELDNYATTTILGDVSIYSGATLSNNSILHVGGNWNNNGIYTSTGSNTNVIFDGSATQNISATTFNNLEFNKPVNSVANLTGAVTLKGNLVGTSGTLDIKNFFFNRDVAGGSATMSDNATLIIAADNAPNLFANYFLSTGSTVIFNGTGTQNLLLPGVVYGNIIFRNGGTKLLHTPITVQNNLTIETGATFHGGANVITLNGNWINNGTFTPATSTVLANGSDKTVSGVTTFNKLTVAGSYAFLSDVTLNGLLNITNTGTLTGGATINTILHGDLTNSGTLLTLGQSTFTGNVVQTLSLINAVQTVAYTVNFNGTVSPVLNSTSAPQFAYLNINNTGGVHPSVGWTVLYGFTVGAGASFNGGVSTHNFLGYVTNSGTITGSGRYNFLPATPVTINLGSNFTNTGSVYFSGAGAITMLGTPISFNNLTINNTNAAGLTPSSDWIITNNFMVAAGSILHAANYNYYVGGNIVNSGTINSQGSTFILNGTGTQDINTLSALNNLTLNKAGGHGTLSNNLTVGGILNFTKGVLQAGAYTVIKPTSATVTGAAQSTGWVAGKLQKEVAAAATNKTFEIGDNSFYTPVSLLLSGVTTGGNLTASTIGLDHPNLASSSINPSKSLNRYWTLTNNGIVFSNATSTFNFVATDVDATANTTNFKASLYNGSSWMLPTTLNPNATDIQATGLTGFGDFTFGEICNFGTQISYTASPYCTTSGIASVTSTGTTGGVFSADPGLWINAATGAIDLAASTPGTYSVTYTIASTADCGQYITYANITIAIPGTWTGAISSDWNNPGNWTCNGIPTAATDVTIPSAIISPSILASNINAVNNLTLSAGTSFTIETKSKFTINGTYTNNGSTIHNDGLLKMAGNETGQTFPGVNGLVTAMNKLEVDNISGVNLDKSFEITGALIPTGGSIHVNDGVTITLNSNADSTASVTAIQPGASITYSGTGRFEVERFIKLPNKWHMVSVPVDDALQTVKAAWAEGLDAGQNSFPGYGTNITGPAGTPNLDFASPGYSLKYWDVVLNKWIFIETKNATITNPAGYFLYVRGDRSVYAGGASTTTLRTRGHLFVNPTVPVKPNDFTSVGNPLASEIDLRKLTLTGSTLGTATKYYMWDPALPGSYSVGGYQTLTYNGSDFEITPGGSGNSVYPASGSIVNKVQSGQALYINDPTATAITFPENSKSDANTANRDIASRTEANNWQSLRITLFANSNNIPLLADGVAVDIANEFNNSVTNDDAGKISNSGENLSIYRDQKKLAVERHFSLTNKDTFQLRMEKVLQKNYFFKIDLTGMEYINLQPFLVDRMLQTETALNSLQSNQYNFNVNGNAASSAMDRFYVVFKTLSVVPVKFVSVNAVRTGSAKVKVDWKIDNEVNMQQYFVERSEDGINFSTIGSVAATSIKNYSKNDEQPFAGINYYRIKAVSVDGSITYSVIVKVLPIDKPGNISVYPNPVTDNNFALQFTGMAAGRYNLQLLGVDGKVIHQEIVSVSASTFQHKLNIKATIAPGYYILRAGKDEKNMVEIPVIVN